MINFYRTNQDYLKFTGTERLSFINRLSTNDVKNIAEFKWIKTVLTSEKGRFVDLLTLYNLGDYVLASCSHNNCNNIITHLEKYTIMDDFKYNDVTPHYKSFLFFGDNIKQFAEDVLDTDLDKLENNNFSALKEKDLLISKNDDALGGFVIIHSIHKTNQVESVLFNNKFINKFGLKETDAKAYEILRITHGIPRYGKEMSQETNPLECNLGKYVSFTKGCYIGQEVIARLDTYDKVSKHLVGLKILNKSSLNDELFHSKITLDDGECGFVTSSVFSEKFGNIGLGFIKTSYINFEKEYKILTDNSSLRCKIVKLPFNQKLNGD